MKFTRALWGMLVVVAAAVGVLFAMPAASAQEQTVPVLGDVNCDGQSNIIDALFVAQLTVGNRTATDQCPVGANEANDLNADMNLDGQINIVDALFISQCTVGIFNAGCPEPLPAPEPLTFTFVGNGLQISWPEIPDTNNGMYSMSLMIDDELQPYSQVATNQLSVSINGHAEICAAVAGIHENQRGRAGVARGCVLIPGNGLDLTVTRAPRPTIALVNGEVPDSAGYTVAEIQEACVALPSGFPILQPDDRIEGSYDNKNQHALIGYMWEPDGMRTAAAGFLQPAGTGDMIMGLFPFRDKYVTGGDRNIDIFDNTSQDTTTAWEVVEAGRGDYKPVSLYLWGRSFYDPEFSFDATLELVEETGSYVPPPCTILSDPSDFWLGDLQLKFATTIEGVGSFVLPGYACGQGIVNGFNEANGPSCIMDITAAGLDVKGFKNASNHVEILDLSSDVAGLVLDFDGDEFVAELSQYEDDIFITPGG